jgi:hypothetical protein
MAVAGAKPKEDRSQVRHRNPQAEGTEWREVDDVPFEGAPPLPPRDNPEYAEGKLPALMGQSSGWPKSTERWWKVVSAMPHCATWHPADWQYAIDTAEAHARFAEGWRGCASGAELRMRERRLGLTHDDRRDLRIRYVPPKDPDAPLPENVIAVNFGEL